MKFYKEAEKLSVSELLKVIAAAEQYLQLQRKFHRQLKKKYLDPYICRRAILICCITEHRIADLESHALVERFAKYIKRCGIEKACSHFMHHNEVAAYLLEHELGI